MAGHARIEVIPDAWRRGMRLLVPALAALALAAAVLLALDDDPAAAGRPTAAAGTTSLWLTGSSLSYADAQEAAGALGWQAGSYSLPGVGISRGAHDPDATLLSSAQRLLAGQTPDVVVLQGGEADHVATAEPLRAAAVRLIEHVRASTDPGTRVVLVGPIPGPNVPESLRRVNDVLAQVAQQQGVTYVDALGQGWRAGDPAVPAQLAAALG